MKCPVCDSKEIGYYLTALNTHGKNKLEGNQEFEYFKCKDCRSVFLREVQLNNAYYKKYYAFNNNSEKRGISKMLEKLLLDKSLRFKKQVLESWVKRKNRKIRILDIGCGNGSFLESLDTSKFDSYGIELNKKEYVICRNKYLQVYNGHILKMEVKEMYDVITIWHVLEHIPEPQKLFKKIRSILITNGLIIISTPNIESFGFGISKENWFHLDAPRHLILYGEKGVKLLCEKNKLRLEKVVSQKFEFPLDLFWSVKQAKIKPFIYLFYPVIKYLDKETLLYIIRKSI